MTYGGIEAGGTKWVCGIGDGDAELSAIETFATTSPEETIARAAGFFKQNGPLDAVGIGSFGPIDVRMGSPTWGFITTTPKPGWAGVDLAGPVARALDVPVSFDTDVNVAALAEWRWGAGAGLGTLCYVTVGTGIGGGVLVDGRLLHGLLHPEVGHMRIPHDWDWDPFAGVCPFHGDCLEGLASGEALRRRWGRRGEDLPECSPAWSLEAEYLAHGLMNLICTLSPERIIVGGGVTNAPGLLPAVRPRLRALLGSYFSAPELLDGLESYIVRPALGARAGVLGAIELARRLTDAHWTDAPDAREAARRPARHGRKGAGTGR